MFQEFINILKARLNVTHFNYSRDDVRIKLIISAEDKIYISLLKMKLSDIYTYIK